MSTLKSWLRKNPQPARIRIRTEDDDEREIALSADVRNRWKSAEEAVIGAHAVYVECLRADGTIERGKAIEWDDGEPTDAPAESTSRYIEKSMGRERKETASLLDAYGNRMVQAFKAGTEAASTSHDALIASNSLLMEHLVAAITSFHKMSTQVGELLAEAPSGKSGDGATNAVAMMLMQNFLKQQKSEETTKPNGKRKG